MTGFIRGLFGGNKQPRAPKPPQPGKAFFLDPDDAKTFGDIDYMRSSKVIKRTFAKSKSMKEELESVRAVSAMSKVDVEENGTPKPQGSATFESSAPSAAPKVERRTADTSMDMFRNMARDIKKK